VTVIGAAGGIGQPLSLLLKTFGCLGAKDELALYDVAPVTPGVAADLSHINTDGRVTGYAGDKLADALEGADIVVCPAGLPRKPGMTRDDLFEKNAGIIAGIANQVALSCPDAAFLVISNPVNSTVPICAEILKHHGVYNPSKLFGVTTLDVVRANTFVAENQGWDVSSTRVPVVGGHAGTTILPLLSQVEDAKISDADRDALTHRIMFGGDEVVKAKAGGGSATLSMAWAGASFANQIVRARRGVKNIKECSFVQSSVSSTPFFSSYVTLGADGIKEIHEIGELNEFEQQKYQEMLPDLQSQIDKGVAFAKKFTDSLKK
jgi:malate dehydrogenase